MSYGNELLADYAFEIEYPFGIAGEYWTTKDGKKIAVKNMPTQHIVNCMKIVGKDDSWYYVFKAELERRIRKN